MYGHGPEIAAILDAWKAEAWAEILAEKDKDEADSGD